MRVPLVSLVSAVSLWLVAAAAHAAVDCHVPTEPVPDGQTVADVALKGILTLRPLGCFGGSEDKDAFAARVFKAVKGAQCIPPTRPDLENLRDLLATNVREINDDLLANASTAPASWAPQFAALSGELRSAAKKISDTEGIAEPVYWEWTGSGHGTFRQTDNRLLLDYEALVRHPCASSGDSCAAALATAVRVNRAVELAAAAHRCAGQAELEGTRKALTSLDAEWNHYFFGARSQFIWELAINELRFKGADDKFSPPPRDQIILAHPGVAFEYVGGGAQNERAYEATVMAEVIGYNKITWAPRTDGKLSRMPPLGASLVATYSPDNTGEHVGYGFMLHLYNTLSFGVTRRDTGAGDETTYLLSADLTRLILNPTAEQMAKFRGVGSSGDVSTK